MTFTYTYTLTAEERTIRDLNEQVYNEIASSFNGRTDAKYSYKVLSKDGNYLEEKPMNLYEEGVLVGDDFNIYKKEGLVKFPGTDINYVYKSEEGELHSFGSEYDKCFVKFPGDIKIGLTDFIDHPEVEEFLEMISKKINNTEEKDKPKGL